jgi:hypothetical protein
VKVNADDLTRLYDYDAAMLDLVDQVKSAIEKTSLTLTRKFLPGKP